MTEFVPVMFEPGAVVLPAVEVGDRFDLPVGVAVDVTDVVDPVVVVVLCLSGDRSDGLLSFSFSLTPCWGVASIVMVFVEDLEFS